MYSRGMRGREVKGKKVEDGEKEESKNEGFKVSFGEEVFSLCLLCVWRREEGFLQCCKRTTERISGIYKQSMESRTRPSSSKRFVCTEAARLQSILFFLQVHT